MSDKNCKACEDLRSYAPDFVANGVTDNVCASLKNDTGLGTNASHNDCNDLNDANDCLIGGMEDEIEAYDTCDWKEYMKKFVPNVYNVIKAIICAICGLWSNIHDLIKRVTSLEKDTDDLCAMIHQLMTPPVRLYGPLPAADNSSTISRRCGTIATKNGIAAAHLATSVKDVPEIYHNAANCGMRYGREEATDCQTKKCVIREWIAPSFFWYEFGSNVQPGDIIWYISKSEAKAKFGISDHLWQAFTESSWTWTDWLLDGTYQTVALRMTIEPDRMGPNYLTVEYLGMSYPNGSPGGHGLIQATNPEKLYEHSCNEK